MTRAGTERAFLSIGEVLDLIKADFPDVTISKIRFLESQGLIDPERTPSGYRKFYEADVARLRWILRQQRENFLPLKVIKDRLEVEGDAALTLPDPERPGTAAVDAANGATSATEATEPDEIEVVPDPDPVVVPAAIDVDEDDEDELEDDDDSVDSASYTGDELASASGLGKAELAELERYGMIVSHRVAGQVYFEEDALVVARLAAGFARHGIGPRHLRMYKTSAVHEAGFYEQVVLPLLKQRNPAARRRALDTLEELVSLGEGLRSVLLQAALRDHNGS